MCKEKLDLKRDIRETQLENEGQVKMLIQAVRWNDRMMGWWPGARCKMTQEDSTYGADIIDFWLEHVTMMWAHPPDFSQTPLTARQCCMLAGFMGFLPNPTEPVPIGMAGLCKALAKPSRHLWAEPPAVAGGCFSDCAASGWLYISSWNPSELPEHVAEKMKLTGELWLETSHMYHHVSHFLSTATFVFLAT